MLVPNGVTIERFHCTPICTYHDFTTPWPGGEPLNENAYWWLHKVVGEGRLTVVDNAWQTGERIIIIMSDLVLEHMYHVTEYEVS